MVKSGGAKSDQSVPASFAETTPPETGANLSMWLLNAHTKIEGTLGRVEATLVGLQTQMNRIEAKVGEVEKEVAGHGKWMHTLKTFAGVIGVLLVWILANAVWPWAKAKLFGPAHP
ncbi:MAG: hypothetical protein ACHQ9S_27525 [Candidatus Binatia bacterium]